MPQVDFETLSESALEHLRQALEASDMNADVAVKAEGVLEVEFDDGTKIIINRHRPAREIWVAARAGGFHFRWDGTAWRDTRSGAELFTALSRLVSAQNGAPVKLTVPGTGA